MLTNRLRLAVACFAVLALMAGRSLAAGGQGQQINGQVGAQGEQQNGQAGYQGEQQNGQAGAQGEQQNGQSGQQGDNGQAGVMLRNPNNIAAARAMPQVVQQAAPKLGRGFIAQQVVASAATTVRHGPLRPRR